MCRPCATTAVQCWSGASATWSAGRIVGGKLYPTKQRPEQKIDAAVALIMATARCMAAQPVRLGLRSRSLIFVG
jgi:hypothetical protein